MNTHKLNVAAVQMISISDEQNSSAVWVTNLQRAQMLVAEAASFGAQLVVLPENVLTFGSRAPVSLDQQQAWLCAFAQMSASNHIWLVAGSLPLAQFDFSVTDAAALQWQDDGGLPYATSVVFNETGQIVGGYRKMHLFDARVGDKTGSYIESSVFRAGDKPGLVDTPWGLMGLGICYDLRFPEYFRWLRARGVQFVVLPSAFTHTTGEAHWEILLRARAIENQLGMIGVNQGGQHSATRLTWGDSMIVDAWGAVLARVGDAQKTQDSQLGEAVVLGTLDLDAQRVIQANMPQNRRL